ncbi:hypothetical protein [Sulfobacillus thermosulfidooxidans]|uniref:hypothetical protein n=1 Tax=Sulfobacillus thermosulfidooxidans TaxID=28034 RepID=UPI0006B4E9C0|nr:hypothetical protein [Sulfobacillus thermosulfidooxidans]
MAGLLAASLGVWISLGTHTVRQAQSILSVVSLLLLLIPTMVNNAAHQWLAALMTTRHPDHIIVILTLGLVILDSGFIVIAQKNFRRCFEPR